MSVIDLATAAMKAHFKKDLTLIPSESNAGGFHFSVEVDKKVETFLVFPSIESRNDAVESYVRDSIENFDPTFLKNHLSVALPVEAIVAIQGVQTANKILNDLLEDFDEFAKAAVNADGRGQFLGHYDNKEHNTVYMDVIYWFYRID